MRLSLVVMTRVMIAIAMLSACGHFEYSTFTSAKSPPESVLVQHERMRAASSMQAQTSGTVRQPLSWQDITTVARSNELESDVAVRHRRLLDDSIFDDVSNAVGGLFAGQAPPPVAAVPETVQSAEPDRLVIEQWIDLESDEIVKTVAAIHAQIEAQGGRVISESVIGSGDRASSAALELRVPPKAAAALGGWLGTLGTVTSSRMTASDVGKTLVDQKIALENLKVTMARLEKLAEKDLPLDGLLGIEKEMTRVRGEIETLEGEQRWLLDRVAFATITVAISREGGPVEFAPHARVHPGPHLAILSLLDPGTRQRTRVGGGVTVHVERYLTLDLDVFPASGGDSRAVIGTLGTALYSGFLGHGDRAWWNPYVGARVGYGYLSDNSALVVAGEAGLEIYKQRYILVEAAARAVAFIHDGSAEVALHVLAGFEIPF